MVFNNYRSLAIKMTTCISSSSVVGLRLTTKQTFQSAIWKSWKMKLAFLIVATLALVCSSWATNAEDEDKDIKLPGKIEWYDTPTFGWSYTTYSWNLTFISCLSELFPLEENPRSSLDWRQCVKKRKRETFSIGCSEGVMCYRSKKWGWFCVYMPKTLCKELCGNKCNMCTKTFC